MLHHRSWVPRTWADLGLDSALAVFHMVPRVPAAAKPNLFVHMYILLLISPQTVCMIEGLSQILVVHQQLN